MVRKAGKFRGRRAPLEQLALRVRREIRELPGQRDKPVPWGRLELMEQMEKKGRWGSPARQGQRELLAQRERKEDRAILAQLALKARKGRWALDGMERMERMPFQFLVNKERLEQLARKETPVRRERLDQTVPLVRRGKTVKMAEAARSGFRHMCCTLTRLNLVSMPLGQRLAARISGGSTWHRTARTRSTSATPLRRGSSSTRARS